MLIYKGAEANLYKTKYLGLNAVEKIRKKKSYRIKEIDDKIRKQRTKQEASMIKKARQAVKTPYIYFIDMGKKSITMEYIKGKSLKKEFLKGRNLNLIKKVAKQIESLHEKNIIHGDLTTSNMILAKEDVYFIDFGLSYTSSKIEDKAVDLLNFKKMLKATHFNYFNKLWEDFEKSYANKKVLEKITEIEKRARYS